MTVGVLTTCHTQYTWDRSICIFFLFNRTTLQVFVTYLTGAVWEFLDPSVQLHTPISSLHTQWLPVCFSQSCSPLKDGKQHLLVDCVWNMMAHAQKPDFVFRRNRRVHLNRRGASVQSITESRGVRFNDSNAGYNMFRGSVKSTGYPLHSPVSHSLPLPCVTVCNHISTGVYHIICIQCDP